MGARGGKHRPNAKGRNSERTGNADRVLILRRSLWQSPRFSSLSCTARVLALELLSMFNGTNNGAIFLSVRDATDRLGFTDFRPALEAFAELERTGLISLTFAGTFAIRTGEVSKAHAWRLNFVDAEGKPASEDSLPAIDLNALPAKSQSRMAKRQKVLKRYLKERQEGKFAVGDFTTLEARRVGESPTVDAGGVEEITTPRPENGLNASTGSVGDSTTHIIHHPLSEPPKVVRLRTATR